MRRQRDTYDPWSTVVVLQSATFQGRIPEESAVSSVVLTPPATIWRVDSLAGARTSINWRSSYV